MNREELAGHTLMIKKNIKGFLPRKLVGFFIILERSERVCKHQWYKVNDIYICLKCGFTAIKANKGQIILDRKLINYKRSSRHAKK